MVQALASSIVATAFITCIAILSCVQFRRSQTPLRLGAAVMAVMGLSISALSIVYVTDRVSMSIFWVYQFAAECISVTWVITTIIHLGYAFYPITRHQTLIWRTALASVILYDLVAMAELSYYCYAVWGTGRLAKEAAPVLWIYWVRQLVKVLACAVTIAYLFVPLVRHHHSAGVAMIADSNTLAVGTWYLSALGTTSVGYIAMFVYYMTKSTEVFSSQAQALDLCLRLLTCPIFSLPPPPLLLRYFHAKYGSTVRGDNPNTMIEEGITNDPRPRRPPMLVSLPSGYSSRRDNDDIFDELAYHGRRSTTMNWSYLSNAQGDDHCNYYKDEEASIGIVSSVDTASETSPKLNPTSSSSPPNQKETETSTKGEADDALLSSLAISIPPINIPPMPSSQDSSPMTPPLAFAHGVSPEREYAETAKAARKISRRLTMEGRKDGLDFLNIAGLMKWPHRPNSTMPATNSAMRGMSAHSLSSLPTVMTGSGFFKPSRSHADIRGRSVSPSGRKREKLSVISDSSVVEEDEMVEEHYEYTERKNPHLPEHILETPSRITIKPPEPDTHIAYSTHHPKAQEHTQSSTNSVSSLRRNSNTPSLLGKKLSIDNIRQISRNALTRIQEGGIRAALSIPATTAPMSPTAMRTAYGGGVADPSLAVKPQPHLGHIALEHELSEHTRP